MVKRNNIKDLFGVMMMLILVSCNTAKIQDRKDNKAIDRATSTLSNLKRVTEIVRDRFPCATDTVTEWEHDTTYILSAPKIIRHTDTLRRNDTVFIFHTDTAEFEKVRTIVKTKTVVDREKENRLTDSLNSVRRQLASAIASNNEKNTYINDAKKEKNKLLYWLIGVSIVAGISAFFAIKGNLKIPFLKS